MNWYPKKNTKWTFDFEWKDQAEYNPTLLFGAVRAWFSPMIELFREQFEKLENEDELDCEQRLQLQLCVNVCELVEYCELQRINLWTALKFLASV